MKSLKILLFALIATLGTSICAHADEPPHPEKPMLWKVEGKELKKPSYLFGTIHLSRPRITTLHPAAEAAFKQAASLHTEIPFDPAAQLNVAKLVIRKDGKTLSDSLGPDLVKRMDAQLAKISPMLTTQGLNQMRTWFPVISLYALEEQMKGKKALDALLWNRATESNKATKALETIEGQLGQLNKFTEKEQIALVEGTLGAMELAQKGEEEDIMEQLIAAYLEGDAEKLEKFIHEATKANEFMDQALADKFKRLLFQERNTVMAASIIKQLEAEPTESHFFAAGSGHYLGKDSVNEALQAAGYTITRITE